MKRVLMAIAGVAILILLAFFQLAHKSQAPLLTPLGLANGKFKACYTTSNCVNSMVSDASGIAPIQLASDPQAEWAALPDLLKDMGYKLEQQDSHYLWLTYRSPFFGFIDDLELVLDEDNHQLHLRSGARVGHSDFGNNRKRVEALRLAIGQL